MSKQISSGKAVHAYLFVGPRGTGKTSTARVLAKALNCLNILDNGDPCDQCDMCNAVRNGSLTDLIEIDAASNRGIDDIRELQSKISLAPIQGRHKVYIIDEVHMLTPPAFNALLKTLEEPPMHVTFILCTTELHKVPDTIKSRCQVFRFKRANIAQLTTKLKFIAESEGKTVEDLVIANIAQSSLGGFRDAETLLQQVIEGGLDPKALLGSLGTDTLILFVDALKSGDKKTALDILNDVYEGGNDLYLWLGDVISYMRDLLLFKSGFSKESFEMSDIIISGFITQANSLSVSWLVKGLGILLEAHDKIKRSFISRLPIEIAIINICGEGTVCTDSILVITPKNGSSTSGLSKNNTVQLDKSDADSTEDIHKKSNTKSDVPNVAKKNIETIALENEVPLVEISVIETKWEEVLNKVKDTNGPVLAMLKSAKAVGVRGKFIVLEVYFIFHKERLESIKNKEIVENVLNSVFGAPLSIVCVVGGQKPKKLKEREVGVLTDANVVPVEIKEIMDVFDGGLPL